MTATRSALPRSLLRASREDALDRIRRVSFVHFLIMDYFLYPLLFVNILHLYPFPTVPSPVGPTKSKKKEMKVSSKLTS